jgi:hypothetical protein
MTHQEVAKKYLEDYLQQLPKGIILFTKKRLPEVVGFRALFYKILLEKENFSIPLIAEVIKKDRITVRHALKQMDVYYNDFDKVKKLHDVYFKPLITEKPQLVQRTKYNDNLDKVIDSIPFDKRDEIYELVNLRVKSWSWKNRDYCEIIEGYNSLLN